MPIPDQDSTDRTGKVVRFVEDNFFGNTAMGGQRALPKQLEPNVTVKITAEIGLGLYEAVEVRYEDDGGGVLTWETFAGARVFTGDNEIFEIDSVTDIPVGKTALVWQSSTSEPSATAFTRKVTWMFKERYSYGVDTGGAWVEITGESSGGGAYSWKQKDADGTTDTSPSVTGTENLVDVNGEQGIPSGTIIWARTDGWAGTETPAYSMEFTRVSFWAKLTSESSGSYS